MFARREAKTRIQQRDWLAKKFAASSTNHVAGFLFSLRVGEQIRLVENGLKTLINRAKTICEVENIEGELEHLRSVLKMNSYPKKFIDNATKTRQHVREKTEYQSSVSLPYIGSA